VCDVRSVTETERAMDPVELNARVARLEESMKTMQAEYRTDIARLAEDMAKRDAESAKHDRDSSHRTIGLFIAAIVIIPILSNSDALVNLVNLFGN